MKRDPQDIQRETTPLELAIFFSTAFLLSLWFIYSALPNLWWYGDDFLLRHALLGSDAPKLGDYLRGDIFEAGKNYFYRPLTMWVYSELSSDSSSVALHMSVWILHLLNGVLVVLFARILGAPSFSSYLAGTFFILHPAGAGAIFWGAALGDILLTTFALLTLILSFKSDTPWRLALLILAFSGALLTKETALMIPLVVWVLRRSFPSLLFSLSAVYLIGRIFLLPAVNTKSALSLYQPDLLSFLLSISRSLYELITTQQLIITVSDPKILFLSLLTGSLFIFNFKKTAPFFLSALIILLPTSSHYGAWYLYLPSVFIALAFFKSIKNFNTFTQCLLLITCFVIPSISNWEWKRECFHKGARLEQALLSTLSSEEYTDQIILGFPHSLCNSVPLFSWQSHLDAALALEGSKNTPPKMRLNSILHSPRAMVERKSITEDKNTLLLTPPSYFTPIESLEEFEVVVQERWLGKPIELEINRRSR